MIVLDILFIIIYVFRGIILPPNEIADAAKKYEQVLR